MQTVAVPFTVATCTFLPSGVIWYGLKDLMALVADALQKSLETRTAAQLLSLCPLLGLTELEDLPIRRKIRIAHPDLVD